MRSDSARPFLFEIGHLSLTTRGLMRRRGAAGVRFDVVEHGLIKARQLGRGRGAQQGIVSRMTAPRA